MAAFQNSVFYLPVQNPRSDSYSGRSSTIERKGSSSSTKSIPISPGLTPKVQLIPHARAGSFDVSLSEDERQLVDKAAANFDALDLSSKDFDFDEIFTYDKPQRKFPKGVVEVSSPTRTHRDWSSFSFSHYSAAMSARHKVNSKAKPTIGELYVKNKSHSGKY
jgi:hypothetical protein